MKKILTGAFAFILFAVSAQAQTRDTIHRHNGGHEMMAKELNLTDQQKASLKSIHESERNEMKTLRTSSLTDEQQKAKRQELHKKYSEQVEAIYTPEQKEQLTKMKAEWKANGKNGGKKGSGKPEGRKGENGFKKGNDFSAQLNLTADQKAKMEQLRNNSKTEMTTIKNDKSLSEDQKKSKMQQLRKSQHEQMKSILTAEQLEKMKTLRKDHQKKAL